MSRRLYYLHSILQVIGFPATRVRPLLAREFSRGARHSYCTTPAFTPT